jgi:RimJ/RimL family protein N-acetyltransferase
MSAIISTPRLILRNWTDEDKPYFAAMNADLRVMEFFPKLSTREESDAMVDRIKKIISERGFGFWCVEIPGAIKCAGFIGLSIPRFESDFTPCLEIGWRLSFEQQGKGYATEGAMAAMDYAKNVLQEKEIFSFTVVKNMRSRNVMEKIGMKYEKDFLHPSVPDDSPVKLHVLYRKKFLDKT